MSPTWHRHFSTYNTFTDTTYTEGFANAGLVGGNYYSYRLCIYGTDGSLTSFSVAQNVMAKLPANVTGFTAAQGATSAGDIDLAISFPGAGETASYDRVEVRRVDGATPPVASCDGPGDNVRTFTTYAGGAFTDSSLTPGSFYSYRVCVIGHDGSLVASTTAENVRSKPTQHTVFFSSTAHNGNLGGVAGADAICTNLANAAGLPGPYKALLSTSTQDVRDRVPIVSAVYDVVGNLIADGYDDMWDGRIKLPINRNETGASANTSAWSSSNGFGQRSSAAGSMCDNWTSSASNKIAIRGTTYSTARSWIGVENQEQTCNSNHRLYCISQ